MTTFPVLDPDRRLELLAPPDGPVDVVIDTDVTNEIDDQFAIVWAALRPDRIRIRALHACPYALSPDLVRSGALLTELDARNLTENLSAMGIEVDDIPVVSPSTGVRRARRELDSMAALLGLDASTVKTGADAYLPDESTPVPSDAADDLIELARTATEPLHVVAIGCATNVASALLMAPDIAGKIVVNWTSAYPSFWPRPNASYNLAQDIAAARVLFDSGVPLVYLPGYYVGEELRVTKAELGEHLPGRGPIGDFLWDIYCAHPITGNKGARSKVIWDIINIAWLLEPAWFTTDLVPTPRLDGDLRWQHDERRPLMREAYDIDRDAVFGDLYRCVAEASPDAST